MRFLHGSYWVRSAEAPSIQQYLALIILHIAILMICMATFMGFYMVGDDRPPGATANGKDLATATQHMANHTH